MEVVSAVMGITAKNGVTILELQTLAVDRAE